MIFIRGANSEGRLFEKASFSTVLRMDKLDCAAVNTLQYYFRGRGLVSYWQTN